jgi:hypothetical protein
MKVYLMHPGSDFDTEQEFPPGADALISDLELTTLLRAMAAGDDFLFEVARKALLCGVADPNVITYRQQILRDCLAQAGVVRLMSKYPSAILHRSVEVMHLFVGALKRLRAVTDTHAADFCSEGFTRFFGMITKELGDDYFAAVADHLKRLKFRDGVLLSARLGPGNTGTGYVLRKPRPTRRGLAGMVPGANRPGYTFTISDRDESGARALSELSGRGINHVANALAQACDHILSFFLLLRTELAFYIGCLNAHEQLTGKGEPTCFPVPVPAADCAFSAAGLYDPCLSLAVTGQVVGNGVDADGTPLVMITGANQGGKSTFLRSVGLAQLMMQSGMFAAASSLRASVCHGLFTHYKREEDAGMTSGKLDEELARMSDIASHIAAGAVLLCNESFASTNEREGSQIARQIIHALLETGIRIFFVTHLYDLAHGLHTGYAGPAVFLRAERQPDGRRTFRLAGGEPLPTSHGKDVYENVFGAAQPGTAQAPASPSSGSARGASPAASTGPDAQDSASP